MTKKTMTKRQMTKRQMTKRSRRLTMPKPTRRGVALLVAALIALAVPGCVELTGQRISWLYDSAKDELQILIHYDGVHDSGGDEHGTGVKKIHKLWQHGRV